MIDQYSTSSWASLLAVGAVVGTVLGMVLRGWNSVKSAFQSSMSFLVTTVNLEDETTSMAVLAHLLTVYRRSSLGSRTYGGKYENFRDGKYGHVPFEYFGGKSIL